MSGAVYHNMGGNSNIPKNLIYYHANIIHDLSKFIYSFLACTSLKVPVVQCR